MLYDNLNGPRVRHNNEFYTKYESVLFIFDNNPELKEYVKDKVIYCPCDSEWSNILKWLKDNKEVLQIKEILNSSDDYYLHLDLYDKADIVITNPPFTGLAKWMGFLLNMKKEFIIWAPYNWCLYRTLANYILDGTLKTIVCNENAVNEFILPDGTCKRVININIVTNIKELKACSKSLVINPKNTIEYLVEKKYVEFYNNIPIVKNMLSFPCDYTGSIYIPFSGLFLYYDNFEMESFECLDKRCKKYSLLTLPGKYRFKVRVKNQ